MSNIWGGKSLPVIGTESLTYTFQRVDNIKVQYYWVPVGKRIIEVESGNLRHRIRGYRLKVIIEFEGIKNKTFIDVMREVLSKREGTFRPHPGGIGHSGNPANDSWEIIPTSDFDFDYTLDKFIGHKGRIELQGKSMDNGLPIDITGGIYATV